MPVYTVHEPPLKAGEAVANADRFVFVRDRFSFWAFVLTPLWLLAKRLWLVFVLYLVLTSAVSVMLYLLDASGAVRFLVMLLIALLAGFEAGSLQRWTLARRKWKTAGVVVADNAEDAERRFFSSWTAPLPETPAAPEPLVPPPPMRAVSPSHPIGLFPEPGASR